jgi:hypothetical protein
LALAIALAAVTSAPLTVEAQVVTTGQWNTMVTPTKDGAPFWDGNSTDNVGGSNCNVGFYLLNPSGGGFGPCLNQHPTDAFVNANAGRLGMTGNTPNGSFLSGATASSPVGFSFGAGTYRLEFLANISAFGPSGQELWAYSGPASAPLAVQQLYAVGSYPSAITSVFTVTFNTEWYLGARSAEAGNAWDYSNSVAAPHFALFNERGAAAAKDFSRYWVGFADTPNGGDHDYNDLIVQIQQLSPTTITPEPSTWALMVFGLGSLGVVARRRTRSA